MSDDNYKIERRWAATRMRADRARLFAVFAIVAALLTACAWLALVSLSGDGRRDFARYVHVSVLAENGLDEPLTMTLDGRAMRGRPEAFRDALRKETYGGRPVTAILVEPLYPAAIAGAVTFCWLLYSSRSRNSERRGNVLRGTRELPLEELQNELILSHAPGLRGMLFRRLTGVKKAK